MEAEASATSQPAFPTQPPPRGEADLTPSDLAMGSPPPPSDHAPPRHGPSTVLAVPAPPGGARDPVRWDRPPAAQRFVGFLRAHPILCLLMLTPGIPEYLSGSSPVSALLLNPVMFVFQLGLNVGLYTTGVLLVREAVIRWGKGWGSVLLLGAAYGVLEEGVALSTMLDPRASAVGALGFYGHWLGVNWVWAVTLDIFHATFSVALPIFLLGMALPETKGRRLLHGRQVPLTLGLLAADVVALMFVVGLGEHFWAAPVLLVGAFLLIALAIVAAVRAPRDLLRPLRPHPTARPRTLAVLGASFFPALLLAETLPQAARVPAALACLLVVGVASAYLCTFLAWIGRGDHEPHLVAFSGGLVLPLAGLGVVSQLTAGVGLVAVGIAVGGLTLFFRTLWRRAQPPSMETGPGGEGPAVPSPGGSGPSEGSPGPVPTPGAPVAVTGAG